MIIGEFKKKVLMNQETWLRMRFCISYVFWLHIELDLVFSLLNGMMT